MPQAAPEDDYFHEPSGDEWWFESFWFSFFVPERRLMVYLYPWFRPGQGIAGGGVLAWDDRAHEPWNIVHNDYAWHMPCADPAKLRDGNALRLAQGIVIETIEPGLRYRIVYDHPDLSIDVRFTGTVPANVATKPLGASQLFAGHVDQPGRIEGRMVLRGEEIAIDCYSMRDRSWGVRAKAAPGLHLGYVHVTLSPDDAFLAIADMTAGGHEGAPISNGYLLRDGRMASVSGGNLAIERDERGRPVGCAVTGEDAEGRAFTARGRATSWFAYQPYPSMFNWSSLAEWEIDGLTGVGEIQDTWSPEDWRRFHEALAAPQREMESA